MGTPKLFEDLEVWQAARDLAVEVCRLSRDGALAKDYGFADQFRESASAVMAAIADGHEQGESGEFLRALRVAKGGAARARSLVHVAKALGYINDQQESALFERLAAIARMLWGFIRYLEKGPAPAGPRPGNDGDAISASRRMGGH
jgi:four helix bundle protein